MQCKTVFIFQCLSGLPLINVLMVSESPKLKARLVNFIVLFDFVCNAVILLQLMNELCMMQAFASHGKRVDLKLM